MLPTIRTIYYHRYSMCPGRVSRREALPRVPSQPLTTSTAGKAPSQPFALPLPFKYILRTVFGTHKARSLLLLFAVTTGGFQALSDTPMISITWKPSSLDVLNPERGIYRFRPLTTASDFESVRTSGATLVYSEIDLAAFRSSRISKERLDDIEKALIAIKRAGIKTIVRIVYAHAIGDADAELYWIEQHLSQLAPLLSRYEGIIYAVQAGCIGPWGEWHSSINHRDTADDRFRVLNLLHANIPPGLTIHVRRPSFKQEFIARTDNEISSTRFGHHNDCLLADATDMGTYLPADVKSAKEYLSRESLSVPYGGETCKKSAEFTRCTLFLEQFSNLGVSYLNGDYHPDVIAELTRQGCWSGIRRNLGYRLELRNLEIDSQSDSENLRAVLTIINTGWAPIYSNRKIIVRIRSAAGASMQLSVTAPATREWLPGKEISVSFELPIKLITPGSRLTIGLPDPSPALENDSNYAVRIPNAVRWDDDLGENVVAAQLNETIKARREKLSR